MVTSQSNFCYKNFPFRESRKFSALEKIRKSTHEGAELFARAAGALTSVVEDDVLIIAHLLDVGR